MSEVQLQCVPYRVHYRIIAGSAIPDSRRRSAKAYGDFSFPHVPGEKAGEQGFLTFWRDSGDGSYYVGGIAVEPQALGKGVSDRMLAGLVAIAQEGCAPYIQADVHPDNRHARRFFERNGFVAHNACPGGIEYVLVLDRAGWEKAQCREPVTSAL